MQGRSAIDLPDIHRARAARESTIKQFWMRACLHGRGTINTVKQNMQLSIVDLELGEYKK
jgi:hypothetical protein